MVRAWPMRTAARAGDGLVGCGPDRAQRRVRDRVPAGNRLEAQHAAGTHELQQRSGVDLLDPPVSVERDHEPVVAGLGELFGGLGSGVTLDPEVVDLLDGLCRDSVQNLRDIRAPTAARRGST
jgi:hypothetical protein